MTATIHTITQCIACFTHCGKEVCDQCLEFAKRVLTEEELARAKTPVAIVFEAEVKSGEMERMEIAEHYKALRRSVGK